LPAIARSATAGLPASGTSYGWQATLRFHLRRTSVTSRHAITPVWNDRCFQLRVAETATALTEYVAPTATGPTGSLKFHDRSAHRLSAAALHVPPDATEVHRLRPAQPQRTRAPVHRPHSRLGSSSRRAQRWAMRSHGTLSAVGSRRGTPFR